ncbi:Vitamin B12 dependent methionine synthase activation subunit [Desulfosporosinus sp. PR]|uniref:Vitamin B12 dependent methionine synthase activation subunit n=1 Tax=Candidatus Desulfosporosinus nitrosoreducens TaxID=3401928 RepID=UPI0027FAE2FC|nr:Vitamin B12 dependent methionine synthase activation subunit [Desulfosporosinus sp. PR]MDQ7092042.1 Vitamin B12 dependent methionine synthase activation subunit [Desulfosporosinus sp. PR]
MTEAKVSEGMVPEVTIQELFTAQGADYSRRAPRQEMVDLNLRLLAEAKRLIRPAVIWQEVQVIGVGEEELYLENAPTLRGRLLPRVLGSADSVILFAMTIGGLLDQLIKEYMDRSQTLEAFILDSAGSAVMAKSATLMMREIEGLYKAKHLKTTFSLGPGHSYWKGLEDVRSIINFLKGERIGISLTSSNLMLPKKSLAMVMGIGNNLPDFRGKTHCDFCHLQGNCTMKNLDVNNC